MLALSTSVPSALRSDVAFPDRARPFDARSAPAYRLLGIQFLLIVMLKFTLGFGYQGGSDINVVLATLTFAIGTAAWLRWRRWARVATAIEGMVLMLASGMSVACLSLMLATIAPPYADPWLAAADARLVPFVTWPDLARWVGRQPMLTAVMCRVYMTLLWQPFLLIALLAATGRAAIMWRLLHSWVIGLTICVAIFALAPAVTPYVHYGFTPADFPALTVNAGWHPASIIARVRDGSIHDIAVANMSGLIAFPSFHTAAGVMLAWGFRRLPVIGPLFVALNVAMILTVPIIGSHYFIDVVAGVAVAIVALAATDNRFPSLPRIEWLTLRRAKADT